MIHLSPTVTAYGASSIEQARKNITLDISHLSSILPQAINYIFHMTKEERNLLVDWGYSGHSPYTNGDDVFDDDGWPLDFINTLRSWNEMQKYCDSLVDETSCDYADLPDGTDFDFPEDFLNATDLPFCLTHKPAE